MTAPDLSPLSPPLRKLCKAIREGSGHYYSFHTARLQRSLEGRALVPQRQHVDSLLLARYAFKVSGGGGGGDFEGLGMGGWDGMDG